MDQQSHQAFRTMDNPGAIAVLSAAADHLTPVVTPAAYSQDKFLDGEKTGAALLFSGVCLALVGITFTTMGWRDYQVNSNFEWRQLLGPILISVGGTFVLTSVCNFGIISCRPSRQWDEEVLVMPVMEQSLARHSVTLGSVNQPVMCPGATPMLCIPPPYNLLAHGGRQASGFQPGYSVRPTLDTVSSVANAAFAAEEDGSAHSTEPDRRRRRTDKMQDEVRPPPAYEDLYPTLDKANRT